MSVSAGHPESNGGGSAEPDGAVWPGGVLYAGRRRTGRGLRIVTRAGRSDRRERAARAVAGGRTVYNRATATVSGGRVPVRQRQTSRRQSSYNRPVRSEPSKATPSRAHRQTGPYVCQRQRVSVPCRDNNTAAGWPPGRRSHLHLYHYHTPSLSPAVLLT